jgi:hypothetical protein
MNEKFLFLTSTRFWAIVIIAVVGYLESQGFIGEAERTLIWTIAGSFGIIRTVDRFSEQMGTPPTATTTSKETGGDTI